MTKQNVSIDRLLTKLEAAEVLGVSARTLDSWMARRKVPYLKMGDEDRATVRFSPADLQTFLDRHRVGGES
jgi:excisionase family DNA binding protein